MTPAKNPSFFNNNSEQLSPRISYISFTGNADIDNGKVQVYSDKDNGSFEYTVGLENRTYAKALVTGLEDGNRSIIYRYGIVADSASNYSCNFTKITDNGNVVYRCNNITVANTEGAADTRMLAVVCDDANLSNPSRLCSWATVPVIFIEE